MVELTEGQKAVRLVELMVDCWDEQKAAQMD